MLRFQAHCLLALAEMQSAHAVDLASRLLDLPLFRERHLRDLCRELNKIRMASSAQLLEKVLEETAATEDPGLMETILIGLAQWPERQVPTSVERVLGRDDSTPRLRALAWKVVANRGGFHGLKRLRKYLIQTSILPKWSLTTLEETLELAREIGSDAFALSEEVAALLKRAERENCPELTNELWAWLTAMNTRQGHLPSCREWFLDSCLPALRRRLAQTEDDSLLSWLNAIVGAPADVIQALVDLIVAEWDGLPPSTQRCALEFFCQVPEQAPVAVLDAAWTQRGHGAELAGTILGQTNPGLLLQARAEDPIAEDVLRTLATTEGFLYFTDGFYAPRKPGFQPYGARERRDRASVPEE